MTNQPKSDWRQRIQNRLNRIGGKRLKKLGFYGFMFFLIKGLLWLIVPAAMIYFGFGSD